MKKYPLLFAALTMAGSAFASDFFEPDKKGLDLNTKKTIQASLSSTLISFRVPGKGNGGTISVTGPGGYYTNQPFSGSLGTINLLDSDSLALNNHSILPPGRYHYRIATHAGPLKLVEDTIDNGRGENNFTYAGEPMIETGSFVVKAGNIQKFEELQEPAPSEW